MDPLFTEIINAETSAESIIRDRLEALDQWMRDPLQDPLSEVFAYLQGGEHSGGASGSIGSMDVLNVHDGDWTETAVFVERVLSYLYPSRRPMHERGADRRSAVQGKIKGFQAKTETTQLKKLEQRTTRQIAQLKVLTKSLRSQQVKIPSWLNTDKLAQKLKGESRLKAKELAARKAKEQEELVDEVEKVEAESEASTGQTDTEIAACVPGDKTAEEAEQALLHDDIEMDAKVRGENPKDALLKADATAKAKAADAGTAEGEGCAGGGAGGGATGGCAEQVDPCACPPEPTEAEKALPVKPQLETYVVVKGDWLSKIAKEKLGDVGRWRELYELNKAVIDGDNLKRRGGTDKSFNWIYPGQILTLPPMESQPETEENSELEDAEQEVEDAAAADPGEECVCEDAEPGTDGETEAGTQPQTGSGSVEEPAETIIQVPYTVKHTQPVTVTKTRTVKKTRPITLTKTRKAKHREVNMVSKQVGVEEKFTEVSTPVYRTESTPIIEKRKKIIPPMRSAAVAEATTEIGIRKRRWTEIRQMKVKRISVVRRTEMEPGEPVPVRTPYIHTWIEDVVRYEKRWVENGGAAQDAEATDAVDSQSDSEGAGEIEPSALPDEPMAPEALEEHLEVSGEGGVPEGAEGATSAAQDTRGGISMDSDPVDGEQWESYWVKLVEPVERSETRYETVLQPGPLEPHVYTDTSEYWDIEDELIEHFEDESHPQQTLKGRVVDAGEGGLEVEEDYIAGYSTQVINTGEFSITRYPYTVPVFEDVPEVTEYEYEETYYEESTEEYEEEESYEVEELEEYEEILWREVTVLAENPAEAAPTAEPPEAVTSTPVALEPVDAEEQSSSEDAEAVSEQHAVEQQVERAEQVDVVSEILEASEVEQSQALLQEQHALDDQHEALIAQSESEVTTETENGTAQQTLEEPSVDGAEEAEDGAVTTDGAVVSESPPEEGTGNPTFDKLLQRVVSTRESYLERYNFVRFSGSVPALTALGEQLDADTEALRKECDVARGEAKTENEPRIAELKTQQDDAESLAQKDKSEQSLRDFIEYGRAHAEAKKAHTDTMAAFKQKQEAELETLGVLKGIIEGGGDPADLTSPGDASAVVSSDETTVAAWIPSFTTTLRKLWERFNTRYATVRFSGATAALGKLGKELEKEVALYKQEQERVKDKFQKEFEDEVDTSLRALSDDIKKSKLDKQVLLAKNLYSSSDRCKFWIEQYSDITESSDDEVTKAANEKAKKANTSLAAEIGREILTVKQDTIVLLERAGPELAFEFTQLDELKAAIETGDAAGRTESVALDLGDSSAALKKWLKSNTLLSRVQAAWKDGEKSYQATKFSGSAQAALKLAQRLKQSTARLELEKDKTEKHFTSVLTQEKELLALQGSETAELKALGEQLSDYTEELEDAFGDLRALKSAVESGDGPTAGTRAMGPAASPETESYRDWARAFIRDVDDLIKTSEESYQRSRYSGSATALTKLSQRLGQTIAGLEKGHKRGEKAYSDLHDERCKDGERSLKDSEGSGKSAELVLTSPYDSSKIEIRGSLEKFNKRKTLVEGSIGEDLKKKLEKLNKLKESFSSGKSVSTASKEDLFSAGDLEKMSTGEGASDVLGWASGMVEVLEGLYPALLTQYGKAQFSGSVAALDAFKETFNEKHTILSSAISKISSFTVAASDSEDSAGSAAKKQHDENCRLANEKVQAAFRPFEQLKNDIDGGLAGGASGKAAKIDLQIDASDYPEWLKKLGEHLRSVRMRELNYYRSVVEFSGSLSACQKMSLRLNQQAKSYRLENEQQQKRADERFGHDVDVLERLAEQLGTNGAEINEEHYRGTLAEDFAKQAGGADPKVLARHVKEAQAKRTSARTRLIEPSQRVVDAELKLLETLASVVAEGKPAPATLERSPEPKDAPPEATSDSAAPADTQQDTAPSSDGDADSSKQEAAASRQTMPLDAALPEQGVLAREDAQPTKNKKTVSPAMKEGGAQEGGVARKQKTGPVARQLHEVSERHARKMADSGAVRALKQANGGDLMAEPRVENIELSGEAATPETQLRWNLALPEIDALSETVADATIPTAVLEAEADKLRARFGLKSLTIVETGGTRHLVAELNPKAKSNRKNVVKVAKKAEDTPSASTAPKSKVSPSQEPGSADKPTPTWDRLGLRGELERVKNGEDTQTRLGATLVRRMAHNRGEKRRGEITKKFSATGATDSDSYSDEQWAELNKRVADADDTLRQRIGAPDSYMEQRAQEKHKSKFRPIIRNKRVGWFLNQGGHAFITPYVHSKIHGDWGGWGKDGDGNFIAPKAAADALVVRALATDGRGINTVEEELGIKPDDWNNDRKVLYRYYVPNPDAFKLRMASGKESGAYGEEWVAGGKTLGLTDEAVIDSIRGDKLAEAEKSGELIITEQEFKNTPDVKKKVKPAASGDGAEPAAGSTSNLDTSGSAASATVQSNWDSVLPRLDELAAVMNRPAVTMKELNTKAKQIKDEHNLKVLEIYTEPQPDNPLEYVRRMFAKLNPQAEAATPARSLKDTLAPEKELQNRDGSRPKVIVEPESSSEGTGSAQVPNTDFSDPLHWYKDYRKALRWSRHNAGMFVDRPAKYEKAKRELEVLIPDISSWDSLVATYDAMKDSGVPPGSPEMKALSAQIALRTHELHSNMSMAQMEVDAYRPITLAKAPHQPMKQASIRLCEQIARKRQSMDQVLLQFRASDNTWEHPAAADLSPANWKENWHSAVLVCGVSTSDNGVEDVLRRSEEHRSSAGMTSPHNRIRRLAELEQLFMNDEGIALVRSLSHQAEKWPTLVRFLDQVIAELNVEKDGLLASLNESSWSNPIGDIHALDPREPGAHALWLQFMSGAQEQGFIYDNQQDFQVGDAILALQGLFTAVQSEVDVRARGLLQDQIKSTLLTWRKGLADIEGFNSNTHSEVYRYMLEFVLVLRQSRVLIAELFNFVAQEMDSPREEEAAKKSAAQDATGSGSDGVSGQSLLTLEQKETLETFQQLEGRQGVRRELRDPFAELVAHSAEDNKQEARKSLDPIERKASDDEILVHFTSQPIRKSIIKTATLQGSKRFHKELTRVVSARGLEAKEGPAQNEGSSEQPSELRHLNVTLDPRLLSKVDESLSGSGESADINRHRAKRPVSPEDAAITEMAASGEEEQKSTVEQNASPEEGATASSGAALKPISSPKPVADEGVAAIWPETIVEPPPVSPHPEPTPIVGGSVTAVAEQGLTLPPTALAASKASFDTAMSSEFDGQQTSLRDDLPDITAKLSGRRAPSRKKISTQLSAQSLSDGVRGATPSNPHLPRRGRTSSLPSGPGQAPRIPLGGQTDPSRLDRQRQEAASSIGSATEQSRAAIMSGKGPEQIQARRLKESNPIPLQAVTLPGAPPVGPFQEYLALGLPGDVQAAFDTLHGPALSGRLAGARQDISIAEQGAAQEQETAIDGAQREIDAANTKAQKDQETKVASLRGQIETKRAATLQQQAQLTKQFNQQAEGRQKTELDAVEKKLADTQRVVDSRFAATDRKTSQLKSDANRKTAAENRKIAAAKKAEADKGWIESAVDYVSDAVTSVINAVSNAISSILSAISNQITSVINATLDFANEMISAATAFVQSALTTFHTWLKAGLEELLSKHFPGLLETLNGYVDRAIATVSTFIDNVAEGLKKAAAATAATVAKTLNTIVGAFETVLTTALSVIDSIVNMDFRKLSLMVLEAALAVTGISREEFDQVFGKTDAVLDALVENPSGFIFNLIDAVRKGFVDFSDTFPEQLQSGMIGWLTGAVGNIQMPKSLDMAGLFSLGAQVMGWTEAYVQEKIAKLFGQENPRLVAKIWGVIESSMANGWEGVWTDHLAPFIDNLQSEIISGITNWLMVRVVKAAVIKIASMFNPVGALIQVLLTTWNVFSFLKDSFGKMMGMVTSVVDSVHDIAMGNTDGAAKGITGVLGKMLPLGIDLLARVVGIGRAADAVQDSIGKVRKKVDTGIDKAIVKIRSRFNFGRKKEERQEKRKEAKKTAPGEDAVPIAVSPKPILASDPSRGFHQVTTRGVGHVSPDGKGETVNRGEAAGVLEQGLTDAVGKLSLKSGAKGLKAKLPEVAAETRRRANRTLKRKDMTVDHVDITEYSVPETADEKLERKADEAKKKVKDATTGRAEKKLKELQDKADAIGEKNYERAKEGAKNLKDTVTGKGKKTKATDSEAEKESAKEAKQGVDVSKLPGSHVLTQAGVMHVGWDAKKGTTTAEMTIANTFAGLLRKTAIPQMEQRATSLTTPDKKQIATTRLKGAKMAAMSAESKAIRYLEGGDNLESIRGSVNNLSAALLDIGDAIGGGGAENTESNPMPAPTVFEADGETHRVWAEAKSGGDAPVIMVASTPMSIRKRVAYWKQQSENLEPASRTLAQSVLKTVLRLTTEMEAITKRIADGDESAVAEQEQKQNVIDDELAELFKHVPDDTELHAQREAFEHRLGVATMTHPVALGVGQKMIGEALKYIKARADVFVTEGATAEANIHEYMVACGLEAPSDKHDWTGKAGKSIEKLTTIFSGAKGASLTEMINHADNFIRDIYMPDVIGPDRIRQFKDISSKTNIKTQEFLALVEREIESRNESLEDGDEVTMDNIVRSRKEYPKSIGYFPLPQPSGKVVNEDLTHSNITQLDDGQVLNDPGGKQNRAAQDVMRDSAPEKQSRESQVSKKQFAKLGGKFSEAEQELYVDQVKGDSIPWLEGRREWLIDTTSEIAQKANKMSIPLAAGLSGSTYRLFNSADLLNAGSGPEVRVAAMGYLLFLHHSFHEIMLAAASQGGGKYSGTCDYTELNPPDKTWLTTKCGEIPGHWEG